ncbi:hypothetical protein [Leyella stercorea]|uniref:hypothetical protein n=1 Tax=Leyella stercorea TaxID=363265 RepID=UPI002432BE2C|nr:hypothetical protein [Leyella stercorea]
MKKILLSAFAMLLAVTANAQNFTVEKLQSPLGVQTEAFGAHKAPAKANIAANQRLVGYFDTDDCDNYVGVQQLPGNSKVAIALTADDLAPYYGKKIAGVRFNLAQSETSTGVFVENVKIKNGAITENTAIVTSDKSVTSAAGAKNTGEWHEVMFDNKVEITSSFETLFVGYCYKQKSNNYPVGVNSKVDGPFFLYTNISSAQGGTGEAWYAINSGGNGLAIQLIVEGDFAPNSVQPLDFGKFVITKGKSKNVAVDFRNIGSKFTSIDYTIALDGKAGAEQHLDFGKDFGVGGTHTVEIPFAADSKIGTSTVTLTVTKVNGVENANAIKTATGTLYTVEREFVKRSVVEEGTGTDCGYCPRGHVAMHNMHNLYGDQFIGIALHQRSSMDPMYNVSYNLGFPSFPQCMVNRSNDFWDPYEQMPAVLKASLNEIALAEVTVAGTFADEDTKVNATASVESLVAGDYDIAFMLTADGLTGKTTSWKQQNYFCKGHSGNPYKSKSSMPEDIQFLWDKGSSYYATYNDVLIASSYVSDKNKATLPTLVANGTVSSEYTLKMPTKVALKKAIKLDQVYVVAVLLDKKTGAIVNAGRARVTGSTGIEDVTTGTEATVVARYTVNGVQVSAPVKGVNILKMSDGTTRKVLVK